MLKTLSDYLKFLKSLIQASANQLILDQNVFEIFIIKAS